MEEMSWMGSNSQWLPWTSKTNQEIRPHSSPLPLNLEMVDLPAAVSWNVLAADATVKNLYGFCSHSVFFFFVQAVLNCGCLGHLIYQAESVQMSVYLVISERICDWVFVSFDNLALITASPYWFSWHWYKIFILKRWVFQFKSNIYSIFFLTLAGS